MSLQLPLQRALFGEAMMNLSGAAIMILTPRFVLSLITSPTRLGAPEPAAAQLLQWLGALFIGLTAPMLLVLPNGKHVGIKRRMVYIFLLAGEAFLIPMLLLQVASSSGEPGSLTARSLTVAASALGPFAALRAYVLFNKPEWFVDDIKRD